MGQGTYSHYFSRDIPISLSTCNSITKTGINRRQCKECSRSDLDRYCAGNMHWPFFVQKMCQREEKTAVWRSFAFIINSVLSTVLPTRSSALPTRYPSSLDDPASGVQHADGGYRAGRNRSRRQCDCSMGYWVITDPLGARV